MHFTLFVGALAATAVATPLSKRQSPKSGESDTWTPAADTKATCDTKADKHISFMRGPQMVTVLNDACAAIMPGCAYQDRLPAGTVCTATIDYQLTGPENSTQHANVIDSNSNSISGWDVNFAVAPAAQPENSPGVFWQVEDCFGYFRQLLEKADPEGCHTNIGSGVGTLKVGGDSSLAGTVFNVTIVKREGSA